MPTPAPVIGDDRGSVPRSFAVYQPSDFRMDSPVPPRSYRTLFVAIAIFALVADLASKYQVFRKLHESRTHEFLGEYDLIPGWFKFTAQFDPSEKPSEGLIRPLQLWSAPVMPYVNKGALFGFLGNHRELANGLFALVSAFAAIAISVWVFRSSRVRLDFWLCLALGLILGGAIGNCYDRVIFHGVRDFLHFYKIDYPVFNVADCALVAGTAILVVQSFLVKEAKTGTIASAP